VIEGILARVGLDRDDFFARIGEQACKDRLKANTDELIARGGFGSPTIYINGNDMYFGNDRLPLVRAALMRAA
jgi:2-hydroxychromene-2-carboxylate isomerase